ncbi:hypothetical protein ABXN37_22570 [Piscinibacter sakaiensis]|uniref:Putative bacteriophage protein n=1 Tax=Piscinibacter sakaiensis TaxID=1547922 RepID=A0A0K8P5V9_PISS1|nr:hypothetical protein [Piscinibacter sakaiensis]GAP37909.1 putative bacteriophage protein [Piscinibacter sakaiensis]
MGKASEPLLPVDWPAIEPHYRAGILSISALSKRFGVSRPAIEKHARKNGWVRSLAPAIHERADRLVDEAGAVAGSAAKVVAGAVAPMQPVQPAAASLYSDAEIVEAGARQLSIVRLEHRADIAALRAIVTGLMRELGQVIEHPDALALVYDALSTPDEPAIGALRDLAHLVSSLPARTKVAKDLAEALHRCIGMEREAFGLDTAGGTDRPHVIVRDYTGRAAAATDKQES